jgi:SAM-dependent methyltransferase
MRLPSGIMANATAYRFWQAPFARQKLAPVLSHNDLTRIRRVLDAACGPGTNTSFFAHVDYLGIDINGQYLDYARRTYGRRYLQADLLDYNGDLEGSFDFVLVNSFFHHVDDVGTDGILERLRGLIAPNGHIHILDLVLPDSPGIARFLARNDRGSFARSVDQYRELFERYFEPVLFEPYRLSLAGVTLWNMVYFKGKPR